MNNPADTLAHAQILRPILNPTLSLEIIEKNARAQIANLVEQETSLDAISINLQALIEQYNAQKSYWGYATHWYGEQIWWLQLSITILAAGVAYLLYVPAVMSIALSLAVSFLLLDDGNTMQARDRLVIDDLKDQENSVQEIKGLLTIAKNNLEEKLQTLCHMHKEMTAQNVRLNTQIATMTTEVEKYKDLNTTLTLSVNNLTASETQLRAHLALVEQELENNKLLLIAAQEALTKTNQKAQETTNALQKDSQDLSESTQNFKSMTTRLNQHLNAFPDISSTATSTTTTPDGKNDKALREAAAVSQQFNVNDMDDEISALDQLYQQHSPQRVGNLGKK
jgi:hypothetical protein